MWTRSKEALAVALCVVALVGAVAAFANTITPQIGGGINQFDGGIASQGVAVGPQPTGKILLADGVSHLLLADGVSRVCRAGGC